MKNNLLDIFNRTLFDITGCEAEADCSSLLKEELGIDSLLMVSLIVELEEALNIVIDDAELSPDELNTVGDVIALVEKYV